MGNAYTSAFGKKLILLCWLLMGWIGVPRVLAQTYTMPTTGSTTVTTCGGTLYDNGGAAGPYTYSPGSITVVPATAGSKVELTFNSFSLDYYDYLTIYDGNSTSAPVIGTYSGTSLIGTVYGTSSSGALTLRLTGSNYYGYYTGFAASIACVTSVPQPDLAVQAASVNPLSAVAGSSLALYSSVYNLSGSAAASSSVGYYLSTNATLDAADQLLGSSAGSFLSVGASSSRNSTVQLPATTTPGSYYILFAADHQNVVGESNEQNNVTSVAFTVSAPTYDLIIQQANATPTNVAQGGTVALSCYISNLGNSTATSSSVGYYLSANATLDAADQLLTSSYGGALAPGSFNGLNRYATTNIPANTPTGSYHILFVADYQGLVSETSEQNNVASVSITVAPPGIDLVMQQPRLSYTTILAGSSVYAEGSVRNQGNIAAGVSRVGFYLSTNTTWDAADALLTSNSVYSLPASQSASFYPTLTIPAATAAGSYYVLFVADDQGQVTEVNEQNNVVSVSITVQQPSVDLTIQQAAISPTSTAAGSSVYAGSYTFNLGTTAASSSNVGYYLSTNTTLDAADVLLASSSGGYLSGGYSSSNSGSLFIPNSTPVGSYYVLFVADYQNQVSETNEQNNVSSVALTITPASPDLMTGNFYVQYNLAAGGTYTASAYITNQGQATAASSNGAMYLSTDNVFSANDVQLATSAGGALSVYNTVSRSVPFTVPSSTTTGYYYVLFVVDHQNQVAESNEQNNVAESSVYVSAPFNGTAVPYSGSNSITSCNTRIYDNGGTGLYSNSADGTLTINPGTSGSKVRLTFSSFALESCCDYLSIYDGTTTSAPLIGRYAATSPGVITAQGSTGALTLRFTTDGSVTDSGFEATVSCVTATPSDLTLSQASASPTTVMAGNATAVSVTVANIGAGDAASTPVAYFLSADNVLDAADRQLSNVVGGALVSGASVPRTSNVLVPNNVAAGNYYLFCVADAANVVPESNEQNNAATGIAITVSGAAADVTLSAPTASLSTVVAGNSLVVTCFHENIGLFDAGAHAIGYYLSTDATFSSGDVLLASQVFAGLSVNTGFSRAMAVTVPAATAPGNYYLLYVADHLNQITEGNEQNNVVSRALAVTVHTATREQTAGFAISLYPNPATTGQAFHVAFAGTGSAAAADLVLYNSLGQLVGQQKIRLRGNAGPVPFATASLPRGVYTLRITGENLNATRHVVVE